MKKENPDWTKKELQLRPGVLELLKAVVEQWHKDGEPQCDKHIIEGYVKMIQQLEHLND